MRLKLTLQLSTCGGREIPINYQHKLSAVIYNILSCSDAQYAESLHDKGFETENKRFKLFNFSWLKVPFHINKERGRIVFDEDVIEWIVSFVPRKSSAAFIQGLFKQQRFTIGDRISKAELVVKEVQILEELPRITKGIFYTLSPICVSRKNERGKPDYLSPEDPDYEKGVLAGLLARYRVIEEKEFEGEAFCRLVPINEARASLITMKEGTPAQTKVRGYRYKFSLELPEELMQIAYESGLGEKTSSGFGMIQLV